VSALHNLYRKPSKLTLTIAGATVAASVAVSAGLTTAAQGASTDQAGSLRPAVAADEALAGQQDAWASGAGAPQIARVAKLPPLNAAQQEVSALAVRRIRLERAARRAAARRAAAARAAARRAAAQRAAAQRAAAQQAAAQQQPAQQPAGSGGGSTVQPSGSPQQIAMSMLGSFGWSSDQFGCLQSLWNAESGWNPSASNPSTGAYGIPQALPGSKMASAGADWQTNPATQIRWGLGYIQQLYGSPCGAWAHEQGSGWY
jgi:Transglycosylase SLT domain